VIVDSYAARLRGERREEILGDIWLDTFKRIVGTAITSQRNRDIETRTERKPEIASGRARESVCVRAGIQGSHRAEHDTAEVAAERKDQRVVGEERKKQVKKVAWDEADICSKYAQSGGEVEDGGLNSNRQSAPR
jgi:hypothetical protein